MTRFVQPPSLKEEARRAVILDELSVHWPPMWITSRSTNVHLPSSTGVELSEASRHATAIKMLEAKVKRREQSLLLNG